MKLTLDTEKQVFFYEQEFYVLSNFSAFNVYWYDVRFQTAEAAYHWTKFPDYPDFRKRIVDAFSAHDAFKLAQQYKHLQRPDWDKVKVDIMRRILWAKALQHDYVRKKLMETGDRELIENSWRDSFWGWGEDRNGQNQLGKLWMEIRTQIKNMLDYLWLH